MNFPKQNRIINNTELAKRYNVTTRTVVNHLKASGKTKTREQYEQDAQVRREIAYNLRQQGLKFREIAERLDITMNNAQQLVRRYQEANQATQAL